MTQLTIEPNSRLRDNYFYVRDFFICRILRDKNNREYLLMIIAASLGIAKEELKKNFELVDVKLGLSKNTKNSEADIVFENGNRYINIEVNYSNKRNDNCVKRNCIYLEVVY